MKRLFAFLLSASLFADGNRTTPPTLNAVNPVGIARGTTVEMTVEGLNLAKASAIYFSEPGVTGKIVRVKELPDQSDIRLGSNGTPSTVDVGPLPPRNQVTISVDIAADAEIGPVRFRILTPLGTSPEGRVLVEPYFGESNDKEPNDTPETAVETFLPAILTGTISRPGDVDFYKFHANAGQQLVFQNSAAQIGATLQPVVAILAEDQSVIREFGAKGGPEATRFAHRFDKAGTYYVRIADYQQSGKGSHFYRFIAGDFPLVTSTYPLGGRSVAVSGYNVPAKIDVKGDASEDSLMLRPNHSFNQVRVAVGSEPELESASDNHSAAAAQAVTVPVTINGMAGAAKENYYRFHARTGQDLVLEVNARRLGSDLDSFIEVLDAKGKPIERAMLRAVAETATALSERNSATREIRFTSRDGFHVGDYVMIGGEVLRIESIPDSPDSDVAMDSFGGQRIAYFDTSTEMHAVDKPIYRVEALPPGSRLVSNGLPVAHLYYQNDDGGPNYGKDSLLHFKAPVDGDYIVGIKDVRGFSDNLPYRLTIREPRPDFRLSVSPRNPNVPAGGSIPVTVTAFRMDGFDGTIDVSLENLPPGMTANRGVIAPGQVSTTLLLSAAADAKLDSAVPLKAVGRFKKLSHIANPDDSLQLISLMPKPDVLMTAQTTVVEIEPGKTAEVSVSIERQNGFTGRVPVSVMHLPPRVKLADIGLNGVLINEKEAHRTFTIEALPNAEPIEQLIYVGAAIETRSGLNSTYCAPQPILLRVKTTVH